MSTSPPHPITIFTITVTATSRQAKSHYLLWFCEQLWVVSEEEGALGLVSADAHMEHKRVQQQLLQSFEVDQRPHNEPNEPAVEPRVPQRIKREVEATSATVQFHSKFHLQYKMLGKAKTKER